MSAVKVATVGGMLSSEVLSSDGFILVNDTSSLPLFSCVLELGTEIQSVRSHDISLILVGNKCDLVRKVSFEKEKNLVGELGCEFMETSAKSDINVANVFASVTRILRMTDVNVLFVILFLFFFLYM